MNLFELSSNKKKLLAFFCGTVVWWYDSRLGCERSRVQLPAVPFSLLLLSLCFKRHHEIFRVVEHQKETLPIVCGTVV